MRRRHLEAFRAVVLNKTVTRAAEVMHISQPAISRMISDLEAEVGFRLFDRSKGRVFLTKKGELLFEEVDEALKAFDRVTQSAEEIRTEQFGTLNIAAAPALAASFMPRALTGFLKTRKNIRINFQSQHSAAVVDLVSRQVCDVGFGVISHVPGGANSEHLFSGSMMCAVPRDDVLATRSVIHPADLAGRQFVSSALGHNTRARIDALFASYGVERQLQVTTPMQNGICSFVDAGWGVALVDFVTAHEFVGKNIVFVPFSPPVRLDYVALYPANRQGALQQEVVRYVREFAEANLPLSPAAEHS